MKKTIKYILIGLIGLIVVFKVYLSSESDIVKENKTHIKKIKNGMSLSDVVGIMGTPKTYVVAASKFTLLYESPPGSPDDYRITFSKTDSLVVDIFYATP